MKRLLLAVAALAGCEHGRPETATTETRQILEGFSLRQSVKGTTSWVLRARLALLHEGSRQVSFSEPRLEFYTGSKLTARAEAERGSTDLGTRDVSLSSAVKVSSLRDGTVLNTENLIYLSSSRKFTTESAVVLNRPGAVLRGRGLSANHDLSELRIRNQTTEDAP